ncbi:MAG: glycosyl transferase, WecB/TagA/CpsF family [Bryobacterales bacterium]|jgi:N-acetylglucosaminyldiphosphoundecaprenol N-acetyl-beta-D-mannosaminyltransferase|nr:glycosyl transferase, WecB/TagA/CpsF family [Bryobacterales bacterium]
MDTDVVLIASQNRPHKQNVAGVGISTTNYAEVTEMCRDWIAMRRSGNPGAMARYICVASVHGVVTARDDHQVARFLNEADIVTPDGMPLVWALRSFGIKGQRRVYGPDLMLRLCESAAKHGHRVFLYGGREDSLRDLRMRLRIRIPRLRIVGSYAPPFRPLTPSETDLVRKLILMSDADMVFVGISTPKQERWMHENREALPGIVMVGVGAAFDFHAGRVRQAPGWMQRNGLEWLFRLVMEPARLWRRYLLVTPRFLPLWAFQRFGIFWRTLRSHAHAIAGSI